MSALVTDSGRKTPARLAGSAILACQSDDRLASMVRAGHERAFDAIVDRYRRPLLRRCRRILPESRAEDAVQQTFLNAHTSLTESADPIQLKPWLYAIARNVSLNMLRQNGWSYEQIPAEFDGVRRPDQVFEQRAELEQTVSAMNELPERQRSALVMREFEGRSYAEIAAVLGANDGAVRQLLNRARAALRTAATAVMPPPLVARIASSSSAPDGRNIAEIAGGLGAAGVAKAGATALVAGSLVVGAVNAPLPLGHHDKPVRERAAVSQHAPAAKAAVPIASPPAAGSTGTSGQSGSTMHRSGSQNGSASTSGEHSGRNVSDNRGSDNRGETEHRSGGDDTRSGSGDTRHSGSDDGARTGTRDRASEDQSPNSGPGGGSDDGVSGTSGSDHVATLGGTDSSGSTSSGLGSGSSEPESGSSGSGSGGSGSDDLLPEPVDGH
jgi:RNA polymerase sigma factor (sigma-70 family)